MDKGFAILENVIRAANMRQKVISSNIANSDTPGYKARDIKFDNFLKDEIRMATTNPGHMNNTAGKGPAAHIVVSDSLSWGDRNNVELNAEVAKMTENSLMHEAAIKILNTKMKMFRSAITVRGR